MGINNENNCIRKEKATWCLVTGTRAKLIETLQAQHSSLPKEIIERDRERKERKSRIAQNDTKRAARNTTTNREASASKQKSERRVSGTKQIAESVQGARLPIHFIFFKRMYHGENHPTRTSLT